MPAAFFRKALCNIAIAFPLAGLALPLSPAALAQAQEKAAPAKQTQAAHAALAVSTPWARAMMPAAKVGAGYFEIMNNGDKPVRLAAVRSNIAEKVEIHSMSMEGNVMKMRHLPNGVEIPPHSGLSFKPGSYHLMFIKPKAPFKAGETFKTQFIFADGREITVPFAVRSAGAANKAHGAHSAEMKMHSAH